MSSRMASFSSAVLVMPLLRKLPLELLDSSNLRLYNFAEARCGPRLAGHTLCFETMVKASAQQSARQEVPVEDGQAGRLACRRQGQRGFMLSRRTAESRSRVRSGRGFWR